MIRLPRFSIPPGPILGAIVMSILALTLIAVIVARSPYTHANLSPEGYNRTTVGYVGQEYPLPWFRLADPRLASTGDPIQDGRLLFMEYACTSCHGLTGQGGAVGKDISGDSALKISSKVREGPKGMPAFHTSVLSDSDLQKIIAFLQSIKH